jgi:dihydrolipoamide dehydrogenase
MKAPDLSTRLAVIGAGPGGYPAAFHAADLGLEVVLIDRDPTPGGVCLYRGCIPSKALLHAANLVQDAREAAALGVTFGAPAIDLERLRAWQQSVIHGLTTGLSGLTRQRGVTFLQGQARLTDAHTLQVLGPGGTETSVRFEHAILATGSEPIRPAFLPSSPRIVDSTGALAIPRIPQSMLVLGGGYIGLELGQVYAAFGARVTVVEMKASLLPGVDPDLVGILAARAKTQFEEVMLNTRVVAVRDTEEGVLTTLQAADGQRFDRTYEQVLVAVGRRPLTAGLGLETTRVQVTPEGFISVDEQRRTAEPSILAIGDVAGQPMLAHKATHEGRAAVEALHDGKTVYAPRAVPAVVFTDPEIAWCGLSEDEARRQGLAVRCGTFPWQASGRAATLGRRDGLTKIVAEADSGRVLGVGIAGPGAGELIGEGVLAIEMGAVAEDIALTIHAHPSLSETLMEAAERVLGQSTHWFQRL